MKGGGDERFAGTGGGIEDDVFLLEQFKDGGLLRGVELETTGLDVFEETTQQEVVAGRLIARNEIEESGSHRAKVRGERARREGRLQARQFPAAFTTLR